MAPRKEKKREGQEQWHIDMTDELSNTKWPYTVTHIIFIPWTIYANWKIEYTIFLGNLLAHHFSQQNIFFGSHNSTWKVNTKCSCVWFHSFSAMLLFLCMWYCTKMMWFSYDRKIKSSNTVIKVLSSKYPVRQIFWVNHK